MKGTSQTIAASVGQLKPRHTRRNYYTVNISHLPSFSQNIRGCCANNDAGGTGSSCSCSAYDCCDSSDTLRRSTPSRLGPGEREL